MKIAPKIGIVFLVITMIFVSSSMLLLYIIIRQDMQTAIHSHLRTTAVSRTAHIKEIFLRDEDEAELVAATGRSKEFLVATGTNSLEEKNARRDVIREFESVLRIHPYFYEISLLDVEGKVVMSTDKKNIGLDESQYDFFIEGRKKPYISDAYFSKTAKEKLVAIAVPIKNDKTGKVLGVLVIKKKLVYLNKITVDRTGLGETGEIFIVNNRGYMITPSRFIDDTFLKQKVDTAGYRQDILHEDEKYVKTDVVEIYEGYRGISVLGTHEYLPRMKWILIAEINSDEVLMPLAKLKILFGAVMILIFVVTVLTSFLISKIIAVRIEKLHKGVEIVGGGNLDYKIGINTHDEIGDFSRTFDSMTGKLKKSTTSIYKLNKEIAERKKVEEAMKEANQRLTNSEKRLKVLNLELETRLKELNCLYNFSRIAGDPDIPLEGVFQRTVELISSSWKSRGSLCTRIVFKGKEFRTGEGCERAQRVQSVSIIVNGEKAGAIDVCFSEEQPEFAGEMDLSREKASITVIAEWLGEVIERREMAEKTEKALAVKSEFISVVSHELRTPLTSIKEGISIVLDGMTGKLNRKQEDFLGVAKRNVDRLARLINDVLDFQKLESGKMQFEVRENNLNEVIKEVYQTMYSLAEEKGLKCEIKLDSELPAAQFDKDRILQVLMNLANNAVKFTAKGSITVTTSREGDKTVRVAIQDTGIGIKKSDLPKLFKRFEQLEKGRGRKTGGTGLGLAISKEIIDLHKGRIWVESEQGKGSTFFVELPVGK